MSDSEQTVIVRVDANQQMGIGHVMRCLALSEELLARGIAVRFVMRELPSQLTDRLTSAGVEILRLTRSEDHAEAFASAAIAHGAMAAVVDGYHLDNAYELALRHAGVRSLRFDDYMPGARSDAAIIVNASPHAEHATYRGWAPEADLLLGPSFITFRSDMIDGFKRRKALQKSSESDAAGSSILVNFGGSDPLDMTIETVQALAKAIPDAPIEAVTGAAYPEPERLSDLGIENFRHHHNSSYLPTIMQRARLAVSAGGLTVQELALFRIPTILAITAENQIKGAHVSWCHTLRLGFASGNANTADMIKEIVREAEMLWNSPAERDTIVGRIPQKLDIHGATRITDMLTGETTA